VAVRLNWRGPWQDHAPAPPPRDPWPAWRHLKDDDSPLRHTTGDGHAGQRAKSKRRARRRDRR